MVSTRKLLTATLFGVIIAVVKGPLPPVYSDFLIIVEAPILALSYVMLGRGGATYTELVNGLVETPFQLSFGPFVILVALLYGVQVDVFSSLLKVRSPSGDVGTKRLVLSLTISTITTGLVAAYTSVYLGLVAYTPSLFFVVYVPILIWGTFSGALGGWLASRIWTRNLKARFSSDMGRS
jgi:ABC-type thiamin/hydroxymethylpyrimidine transport system permease subunit